MGSSIKGKRIWKIVKGSMNLFCVKRTGRGGGGCSRAGNYQLQREIEGNGNSKLKSINHRGDVQRFKQLIIN